MEHAEVPEALNRVVGEVKKESQRIRDAGGEALRLNRLDPASKAIEFARRMEKFVGEVRKLGEAWNALQTEMEGAAPEVKEIVLPTKARPHKAGYTRKVETVSPKTNFTVTFPDGTTVADRKAKTVFAKSIEKLGVEAVAALNIVKGGEPLVSRRKADFGKQPTQVHPIAGGWFVKTHSSTADKMRLLAKIAKALNCELTIRTCGAPSQSAKTSAASGAEIP